MFFCTGSADKVQAHSRGFHVEGLIEQSGVTEANPFSDDVRAMLLGLKARTMPNGRLTHLATQRLRHPLNGVFVES